MSKSFCAGIVFGVILFVTLMCSLIKIPNKTIGLEYSFGGKYLKTINTEGINLINPFHSIKKVSLKNNQINISIDKYAKDGVLKLEFVSQVRLNPENIVKLFNDNVINIETIINSYFSEATEKVISQYNIIDIMAQRTEVTVKIKKELTERLNNQSYFFISDIILSDIDFPDAVEKALQERVMASQQVEKEKANTLVIEEQNKQKLIVAKTEAETIRIKNEALKNNSQIIKLQFIEKWNGILPNTIGGDIMKLVNN